MRKLVLILGLIIPLTSHAQFQNDIWIFGQYAGLDFTKGSPAPITTSVMIAGEGSASIADAAGNLLFYTNGEQVWDKNNNVMSNGNGLGGNTDATQPALIVPKPGSSTLYYIFALDAYAGRFARAGSQNDSGLNYNVVDMTLNGGLGDVSVLKQPLLRPACEKLTATLACNGVDVWVTVHQWDSDAFYSYLVSANGIGQPVISHVGVVHTFQKNDGMADAVGSMKFSPNGSKLALVCSAGLDLLQVFDFDKATGIVSNSFGDYYHLTTANRPNDVAYGVSFSPDNTKLYVSHYSVQNELYQYDLMAGDSDAIIASRVTIAHNPINNWSGMQNGPDGKLYINRSSSGSGGSNGDAQDSLDVINNPNDLGAACNYVAGGVYLGGNGVNRSTLGLPNMIESYISQLSVQKATLTYSGCHTKNVITFDSSLAGATSYHWIFGDSASASADSSTEQNPTHTFTTSGTYTITLIAFSCKPDTIVKKLVVDLGVSASINPPSASFCAGQGVQLTASGGNTYTWMPSTGLSASTGSTVVANPGNTTTYTLTSIGSLGCSATQTEVVNVLPAPTATFNFTVTGKQVSFMADTSTGSVTTYQWDFGDGSTADNDSMPTHTFATSDTFSVCLTVYNNSNCSFTVCKYVDIVNTGVKDITEQLPVSIYPNPANNHLTLINSKAEAMSLQITNILGQALITKAALTAAKQIDIDISSLPAGVYLLQVKTQQAISKLKFVKD